MKDRNDSNRFEETAQDVMEFCRLQIDAVKLRVLESLATLFNSIFSVFVLVMVAFIALLFLAVALTLLLANWTGSLLIAVLIMAGFFILLSILVYALRKKLIVNPMVRMLSKLLFAPDKEEE